MHGTPNSGILIDPRWGILVPFESLVLQQQHLVLRVKVRDLKVGISNATRRVRENHAK
jgi:hypothetical protein